MKFISRDGAEISKELWRDLFNDNSYRILEYTKLPDGDAIETAWIGIQTEYDPDPPQLFVTVYYPASGVKHKDIAPQRNKSEDVTWTSTELDAMQAHEAAVAGVGIAAKEPKLPFKEKKSGRKH